MTKKFFIFVVLAMFVAAAVLLFVNKNKKIMADSDNTTPTPSADATMEPTPQESPVPQASPVGKVIKLDNGLQYQDMVVGTGAVAKAGNVISVHYAGTLANGTPFDSSYTRGTPFEFTLGNGQVIQGWDIGVAGMKIGGKRRLVIPPSLGYGPNDYGPIPGNSTLLFDVELLKIGK